MLTVKGRAVFLLAVSLLTFGPAGCQEASPPTDDTSGSWLQEPPPNMSDTWNHRVKTLTIWMSGRIPAAGSGISLMLRLFWPLERKDIWGSIEDSVRQTVDEAIVKQVLKERSADLQDLQDYVTYFSETSISSEKAMWLVQSLAKSTSIFNHLAADPDHDASMMPIAVTVATIHMNLLRERYQHGSIYWGGQDPVWLTQMTDQYDAYIRYFQGRDREGKKVADSLLDRWSRWRATALREYFWKTRGLAPDCFAQLNDTYDAVNRIVTFKASICSTPHRWDTFMGVARKAFLSRATLELADETLVLVALLPRILPEGTHPDARGALSYRVDPDLRYVTVGPLGYATIPEEIPNVDPQKDPPDVYGQRLPIYPMDDLPIIEHDPEVEGTIRRVIVREWNAIDGLQFEFSDGYLGPFIGNPSGGKLHEEIVRPDGTYLAGLSFLFNDMAGSPRGMNGIKFYLNSGFETAWYGNRGGWTSYWATVRASNYEVVGAGFSSFKGQDSYGNVTSLSVKFRFRNPPLPTFRIGGTVKGLEPSRTVVLQDNGGDDLAVRADGSFTFPGMLATGADYRVTVKTQPDAQQCVVTNGSGTVVDRDVTDVTVVCSGGSLSGAILQFTETDASQAGGAHLNIVL